MKYPTFFTKKTTLIAAGLGLLSNATTALAADSIFDKATGGLKNTVTQAFGGGTEVAYTQDTFLNNVFVIINYLLNFTGVLFFIILAYSGWLWMFARGNQEKVEQGKKITKEVIIGIIIVVTARIITQYILFQIGQAGKA